jgi:2'-5' RNA ligase
MPRLFIAVWPPADVLERLAQLPRSEAPGLRWVPAERWHVTLRFLGDCDLVEVGRSLDAAAFSSARAVLGPRVSRFGRSLVVVPVSGLDELAADVSEATRHLGEPPDPRPFEGHITLARLQQRSAGGIVGAAFSDRFAVCEVTLVESVRSRAGLRYDIIGRWQAVES